MITLSMLSSEADHVLCGADANQAQRYTVSCYCELNIESNPSIYEVR